MSFYEHVFIARQELSKSQVDSLTDKFSGIIKEMGGKVTKTEYWGLKTLAYKIQKNKKGHYTLFNIDAPSAAIAELERKMRIDENVIRYLSIKVDELDGNPSVMMAPKREDGIGEGSERGERGERSYDRNSERGERNEHNERGA